MVTSAAELNATIAQAVASATQSRRRLQTSATLLQIFLPAGSVFLLEGPIEVDGITLTITRTLALAVTLPSPLP